MRGRNLRFLVLSALFVYTVCVETSTPVERCKKFTFTKHISKEDGQTKRFFAKFNATQTSSLLIFGKVDPKHFKRISVNFYEKPDGKYELTGNVPMHVRIKPEEKLLADSYSNGTWDKRNVRGPKPELIEGAFAVFKINYVRIGEEYAYEFYINEKYMLRLKEKNQPIRNTNHIVIHGDFDVFYGYKCYLCAKPEKVNSNQ